jgi:hypothetical protein
MKRGWEIVSGIGVFLTSFLSAMAVLKMIFYYQQSIEKVPLISLVSLGVTGLAVLLSLVRSSCSHGPINQSSPLPGLVTCSPVSIAML